MKKYLTFTNFIALFAFITLMLFFTPCIQFVGKFDSKVKVLINLFQASFGTTILNPSGLVKDVNVYACAGLIIAFVFLVIGILLSIAKNKVKLIGFLASAFYITSGILIACALPLVKNANYESIGSVYGTAYRVYYYGWTYAIATLVLLIGVTAFFETIASTAKPKVQEVY